MTLCGTSVTILAKCATGCLPDQTDAVESEVSEVYPRLTAVLLRATTVNSNTKHKKPATCAWGTTVSEVPEVYASEIDAPSLATTTNNDVGHKTQVACARGTCPKYTCNLCIFVAEMMLKTFLPLFS